MSVCMPVLMSALCSFFYHFIFFSSANEQRVETRYIQYFHKLPRMLIGDSVFRVLPSSCLLQQLLVVLASLVSRKICQLIGDVIEFTEYKRRWGSGWFFENVAIRYYTCFFCGLLKCFHSSYSWHYTYPPYFLHLKSIQFVFSIFRHFNPNLISSTPLPSPLHLPLPHLRRLPLTPTLLWNCDLGGAQQTSLHWRASGETATIYILLDPGTFCMPKIRTHKTLIFVFHGPSGMRKTSVPWISQTFFMGYFLTF